MNNNDNKKSINDDNESNWKQSGKEERRERRTRISVVPMAAIIASLAIVISSPTTIQPVSAHVETILTINIHDQEARGIVVVVGHSNEPAYGAKPGIHDGLHGLEVTLSDNTTGLPIGDAQLKADKYHFRDLQSFNTAPSVDDANQIEQGADVRAIFGETGRYESRQVVADGIYGYRIYGNVSYFGAGNVTIDSTVFCTASDADGEQVNTTKFNSEGWSGSFGCPQDIDTIAFPTNNTARRDDELIL
ncbi:MAG: hypothetical protein M3270_07100 [Thermoproteota archaeon]|nr:hypothetical protein [Thermoproteota archaeon]